MQVCGTAYRQRQDNDQGGISPAFFRCRLSCHAFCRGVVLSRKRKAEEPPPTWALSPVRNAPDCCERLARPCTGKPPSTFVLSCPGPLGQTGLSPESCTVVPSRFEPRQAGRWRYPGQQNTMIHTSPSSGIYQLSHVCNSCDHRELFLGERTTACRHFMVCRCHTSGKGSQLLCSCMLMMVPPVTTFNALSMLFKARTCSEQAP